MDPQLSDVEELTLCSFCKQKFNDTDVCPKILPCKHYFCIKCIETTMVTGLELHCVHCWKRTELDDPDISVLPTYTPILSLAHHLQSLKTDQEKKFQQTVITETCPTHNVLLSLWCHTCHQALCSVCMIRCDHPGHVIQSQHDAKDQLLSEVQVELMSMNRMLTEIHKLSNIQKDFLVKILEACVTLKTYLETELQNGFSTLPEMAEIHDMLTKAKTGLLNLDTPLSAQNIFTNILCEKQRLEHKYNELLLQCKLDDIIGNAGTVVGFQSLTQIISNLQTTDYTFPRGNQVQNNPILLLTNFLISQLYSKYGINKKPELQIDIKCEELRNNFDTLLKHEKLNSLIRAKPKIDIQSPRSSPLFYFNIEVNNNFIGRIVIETRPDLAPKMSKNFEALCTNETGVSYKSCLIFQCWANESIITGDFESNNGRGGHSIYEDGYFIPDETKMTAVRGTVGMRRTQKRHDHLGMVGSQFRIILQEMRNFSAIFGHVVEGLEIIEKIASFGDSTGKPTKNIIITACGKL